MFEIAIGKGVKNALLTFWFVRFARFRNTQVPRRCYIFQISFIYPLNSIPISNIDIFNRVPILIYCSFHSSLTRYYLTMNYLSLVKIENSCRLMHKKSDITKQIKLLKSVAKSHSKCFCFSYLKSLSKTRRQIHFANF